MWLKKSIQIKLLEFFVLEVTARSAANLLEIHLNTAPLLYTKNRQVISYYLDLKAKEVFNGEIETDESYFGGVRKGKRGRGAAGKTIVFGILKRQGNIYTLVLENTKTSTLMAEILRKISPDGVVYTDYYHSYDALNVSEFHHHRIDLSDKFVDEKILINGIENFWNQAKRILRKYNRIDKNHFPLFLKECEYRFNYGTPKQQLKTLQK